MGSYYSGDHIARDHIHTDRKIIYNSIVLQQSVIDNKGGCREKVYSSFT